MTRATRCFVGFDSPQHTNKAHAAGVLGGRFNFMYYEKKCLLNCSRRVMLLCLTRGKTTTEKLRKTLGYSYPKLY